MAAFDFDKAVERARRDFPKETAHTTFIDLDAPDAQEKIYDWVRSLNTRALKYLKDSDAPLWLSPEHTGFTLPLKHTNQILVGIHSKGHDSLPYFKLERDKQAAFTFEHELGHVVVKQRRWFMKPPVNKMENASDAFALMRGFQQGWLDKLDARNLADARMMEGLSGGGFDHLTTMAVDAVVINPAKVNYLALSPQQTAHVARQYADAFYNDRSTEKVLSQVFNPLASDDTPERTIMQVFTDIALNAPRDSHEFYLAARYMLPALAEMPEGPLKKEIGVPGWRLRAIFDDIAQKARGHDIGAERAAQDPSFDTPDEPLIERILKRFRPLSI